MCCECSYSFGKRNWQMKSNSDWVGYLHFCIITLQEGMNPSFPFPQLWIKFQILLSSLALVSNQSKRKTTLFKTSLKNDSLSGCLALDIATAAIPAVHGVLITLMDCRIHKLDWHTQCFPSRIIKKGSYIFDFAVDCGFYKAL